MKKTTYLKSMLLILFFSIGTVVNAQAPFGDPPPTGGGGSTTKPPTLDRDVSISPSVPTTYIPLCTECTENSPPNGTYGESSETNPTSCVWREVENTGNDVQIIDDATKSLTAQVMVWDGQCPHFSLVVSGDPTTQNPLDAAFLVAINGQKYGDVHDPDIIVAQKNINSNEIDILLVYELHQTSGGTSTSYIAYEQWKYNHNTNIMELVPIPNSSHPSNKISLGNAHNPNIDANNNNEIVVVYERDENIYSYVDYITSPTIFNPASGTLGSTNNDNLNNRIDIGHCEGGVSLFTPDASISDNVSNDSYVSYVFNKNSDLYTIQETFSTLETTKTLTCFTGGGASKSEFIQDNYIFPRISSPSESDITFINECAITAVSSNLRDIGLFTNYYSGGAINHITNLNNGGQNLLQDCEQTMPSITYAHESGSTVAVAWTYDDCAGYINGDKEVISVAYKLSNSTRIPSDSDYFMKVNQTNTLDQYASSVAGESPTNFSGDDGMVFYSLASETGAIIYKMSSVTNQPQLRIKIGNEETTTKPMVNIYPNPTNRVLNLDLSNFDSESRVNINIYTLQGKVVHQESQILKDLKSNYDLSVLGKGIYFIEINSADFNYSNKIIVE